MGPKGTSGVDDVAQEVADYARRLGIGTSAQSADFDYLDFAPKQASMRLGDDRAQPDAAQPLKKSKNKFKNGSIPTAATKFEKDGRQKAGAAVEYRPWNAGVGRRPGVTSCL
jgi:hypothetical protein